MKLSRLLQHHKFQVEQLTVNPDADLSISNEQYKDACVANAWHVWSAQLENMLSHDDAYVHKLFQAEYIVSYPTADFAMDDESYLDPGIQADWIRWLGEHQQKMDQLMRPALRRPNGRRSGFNE